MQHLLFRFDASSDIGLGHAFRCYALIEHITNHRSKYAANCVIIAKVLPTFMQNKLVAIGAQVHLLDNSLTIMDELEQISTTVHSTCSEMLILDGYQFDQAYRQKLSELKNNSLKVATFDDTNDLDNLYCDLVINALPNSKMLGYKHSAANARHLLGLSFSIVRQEYLDLTPLPFSKRDLVVINFGGSDIGELTLPVIKGLAHQLQLNNLVNSPENIVVITGGGCKHIEPIELFCHKMGFRHINQCENMAQLLNQSRLALCAPGAIVYELAYCQVPSIFLTVADNQLLSAKAHQDAGWCYAFDGRSQSEVNLALDKLTSLWLDNLQLENMSALAKHLVDGKGVTRIVDALLNTKAKVLAPFEHTKNIKK